LHVSFGSPWFHMHVPVLLFVFHMGSESLTSEMMANR
jgi:hypothetical protein